MAIVASFLLHEYVGVFANFFTNTRIGGQISLQSGMVLQKILVIYERRIFAKLLRDLAVFIQEIIEACQLAASDVVIAARDVVVATIFLLVKTVFRLQESIWILLNFLANGRVIAQKVLQSGMGFYEFLIVHKRGILAQLFRNFPMAIQ